MVSWLDDGIVDEGRTVARKIQEATQRAVLRALPDLDGLEWEQAGGVVRRIAEGVLETFEPTAIAAAEGYYKRLSEQVYRGYPEMLRRAAAERNYDPVESALRRTRETWLPYYNKTREVRVDKAVGRTMQKYQQGLYVDAGNALAAGLSRDAGNAFREAVKAAALNDSQAGTYQRVASAGACAFCMVVSLNQYTSFPEDGGYHDNCSCVTVPVFKGSSAFKPDYYDTFESEYEQGRADAGSDSATDILAAIRASTNRR